MTDHVCLVCAAPATNQYQKTDGLGNTTAVFTCATHALDSKSSAAYLWHAKACQVVPCTCTPVPPVQAASVAHSADKQA